MLTLRCSRCKRKLWRYDKVGAGRVLRCYKGRITRVYEARFDESGATCPCGAVIGPDEGPWIKMVQGAFTATGTKRSA